FLAHTKKIEALLDGKQAELLVGALSDALAHLDQIRQGNSPVTWGDIHRAAFKSADFKQELVATDGGDSSPNVAQSRCLTESGIDSMCITSSGAVYRLVVGFDEDGTPNATYNWPKGDRVGLEDWVEGNYRSLLFRRTDVEAATTSSASLTP